jgi:hypothetical protein
MWLDIGIVALFLVGIYAFIELVGWRTKPLSRRTNRRAEDMYDQYADSPRQQRRYAQQHGGSWPDGSGGAAGPRSASPPRPASPPGRASPPRRDS